MLARGIRVTGRSRYALPVALLTSLWGATSCGSATDAGPVPVAAVIVTATGNRLVVGESQLLGLRLEDADGNELTDRTTVWSTTNSAVASVSEAGLVHALAPGSVQIIATSEQKTGAVTFSIVVPIAQVTVEPAEASLQVGQTLQLTAVPRDNAGLPLTGRQITWTSSNASIAAVAVDGRVSAVSAGGPIVVFAASEGKADSARITVIPHPCDVRVPISVGDTVNASLQSADCLLDDGTYIDFWQFTLTAQTSLLIEMGSSEFDTWLYVLTPSLNVIDYDDDTGPGTNSRLRVTLPAGTYVIGASSYSSGESGTYSLSLGVDPNAAMCAVHTALAIDDTVSGTIANTDCVIFGAFYADRWRLRLPERHRAIDVRITSPTMEPFVLIADTLGYIQAFDDDGGGPEFTLSARLDSGTYDVWATTWWSEATGNYALSVHLDPCGNDSALAFGATVTGSLSRADCALNDSTFADAWRLTVVDSTTPLRVELASPDFDAYLVLTDLDGELIATDDDAGPGSSARIETTLSRGQYLVWANSYAPGDTGSYTLSAAVLPPLAVNFVVDGAYLVQATQRYDGTVPLITGRSTIVRAFGRATALSSSAPSVRVRFYDAGVLVDSITIPAASPTVGSTIDQGIVSASWNAFVPTVLVKPGLSITATIDPDNRMTESDETDNVWPQDSQPRAVNVRTFPKLNLTFVPVRQQVNGLLGNITTSNLSTYTDLLRRIFPLDTVNAVIRTTYTTSLPALQPYDENGAWLDLLSELEAIRVAENPSHHYYGVVKVAYTSGVLGVSMDIPSRVAASIDDLTEAPVTTAHELGHNFGRYHSPCGGAGGPDPRYPYAGGAIGVYGYDHVAQRVIERTAPDIMSYCEPPWISDYTFSGVLSHRDTSTAAPPPAQSVLLVWGTIADGRVKLEPAFRLVAPPMLPAVPGPWRVQLLDARGGIVASHSFTPTEIHDGARSGSAFTFALPIDNAAADRVASIVVVGPAGNAEVRQSVLARSSIGDATGRPTQSRDAGRLTIDWSVDRYPLAMIRDARTGQILSFVRGGRFTVPAASPKLDVLWSDGVRTYREEIVP